MSLLVPACPHELGVVHRELTVIARCDRSHAGVVTSGAKKETETIQTERDWVEIVGETEAQFLASKTRPYSFPTLDSVG